MSLAHVSLNADMKYMQSHETLEITETNQNGVDNHDLMCRVTSVYYLPLFVFFTYKKSLWVVTLTGKACALHIAFGHQTVVAGRGLHLFVGQSETSICNVTA